ncbi:MULTISPECIES: type II toxin-antitoxin system RelE/ParE family toxin [Pantoea]|uniref:type II toxin-antitoxin system RelE/ParE family toxin n=1 Tax=Pantoea TaxID=53335 RepID=UPI00289367C6|nr:MULTISPECIES: type II toxin-antitoxin system RelE/ParE family toxin [unclassified Pantoea]MCG7389436.1 type II toxin-antitoxin system RelE/ParE family toxin [Pantoea sp. ACRSB]
MGQFRLTDEAKEDLKEVKAHSLTQWGPVITKAYLHGMRIAMQMLANHQVGIDVSDETWPGVCYWPYESHYLYFLRVPEGIQVIAVIHQSRLPKAVKKRQP